jgi:hypothetical protein
MTKHEDGELQNPPERQVESLNSAVVVMQHTQEHAKVMLDIIKSMNKENERAMQVHQDMLENSINYIFELRERNRNK